jgi:hypothetical protein
MQGQTTREDLGRAVDDLEVQTAVLYEKPHAIRAGS